MRYFAFVRILALLLATLTAPGAGRAEAPPRLLDPAAVPILGPAGQDDYRQFLEQPTPRVFALNADGAWGWAAAQPDMAQTEARALALCQAGGGARCRVYARDLAVVWPGLDAAPPPVPTRPLAAGPGWALVADGRFLWQGAGAARGAYVWGHGRALGGADSRGSQPQPHVRVFNNAGWDVLRFDRAPATDMTDDAAAWLRDALRVLRARGYARIVVGGQSRGAWNALQALAEPGLADAVIAIAPAAHGARGSPAWAWAVDDLRDVLAAARSPAARIAVAVFAGDEFDPDPDARATLFRGLGAPQVGAVLLLDRPAGLAGHGGGADPRFTRRYGACLLDFAEGRAAACP